MIAAIPPRPRWCRAGLLLLASLGLAACLHSQAATPPAAEPTAFQSAPGKPLAAGSPRRLLRTDGVRKLQQALGQHGFHVPASGTYDRQTEQAVLAFQRREGLAPTSMPDLETLRRLGLEAKALYSAL